MEHYLWLVVAATVESYGYATSLTSTSRAFSRAIVNLERRDKEFPQPLYERRIGLLTDLLETSQPLAAERHRAAERFLATETGQREIEHAIARCADAMTEELRQQVDARRKSLASELEAIEQDFADRQRGLSA